MNNRIDFEFEFKLISADEFNSMDASQKLVDLSGYDQLYYFTFSDGTHTYGISSEQEYNEEILSEIFLPEETKNYIFYLLENWVVVFDKKTMFCEPLCVEKFDEQEIYFCEVDETTDAFLIIGGQRAYYYPTGLESKQILTCTGGEGSLVSVDVVLRNNRRMVRLTAENDYSCCYELIGTTTLLLHTEIERQDAKVLKRAFQDSVVLIAPVLLLTPWVTYMLFHTPFFAAKYTDVKSGGLDFVLACAATFMQLVFYAKMYFLGMG